MKLSTGKVAFPIEFDNGDTAVIYFNPADRGIQERIEKFEESVNNRINQINIEKYKEQLEDSSSVDFDLDHPEKIFDMSPDELNALRGKLDIVKGIEDEYSQAVKDELDVVFGSKISDVAFRYCQPFDSVIVEDENGNQKREMYIMHFVHWLMIELKKYGEENKSAMNKHLAKYVK